MPDFRTRSLTYYLPCPYIDFLEFSDGFSALTHPTNKRNQSDDAQGISG
jgi:hypothetical protein